MRTIRTFSSVLAVAAAIVVLLLFAMKKPMEATAVFTLAAAIGAGVYVVLTYKLWQAAVRQNEANLMLTLMVEYDGLRSSIENIREWYMECASSGPVDPLERFSDERYLDGGTQRAWDLDAHRFRVSRFFVKTRKLATGGYLSEDVVVRALERAAVSSVFLEMVDPLDAAKAGFRYDDTDREFYLRLLRKYPEEERPDR